jgi:hypothetical protein
VTQARTPSFPRLRECLDGDRRREGHDAVACAPAGLGRHRRVITLPFIQVHLSREAFDSSHEEIGLAIHEAQIDALGIPADDRFQVFQPHDVGEIKFDPGYNGVDRQNLVVIRVTAVHMYSTAIKQLFFRTVVDKLKPVGIRSEDVLICLTENGFDDWYAGRF